MISCSCVLILFFKSCYSSIDTCFSLMRSLFSSSISAANRKVSSLATLYAAYSTFILPSNSSRMLRYLILKTAMIFWRRIASASYDLFSLILVSSWLTLSQRPSTIWSLSFDYSARILKLRSSPTFIVITWLALLEYHIFDVLAQVPVFLFIASHPQATSGCAIPILCQMNLLYSLCELVTGISLTAFSAVTL